MEKKSSPFLPDLMLGSLVGLCPVIVVSGNFASGVIVALGILFCTLVMSLLMPALRSLFPERLRAPLAFGLAAAFTALYAVLAEAYSPLLSSLAGIFIPLTLVNCIVLATLRRGIRTEEATTRGVILKSFMFFSLLILVSAFREIAGAGRITLPMPGTEAHILTLFSLPPLRLLTAPAGGFILIGCLAALYRFVQRRLLGRRIS